MKTPTSMKNNQNGAALFIALIMLLVITLLAVSSMRETTLEARITANRLESKRLMGSAEAGLREGERRLSATLAPPETCGSIPCIQGIVTNYDTDFSNAHAYSGLKGNTSMNRNVHWYMKNINAGGANNEAEDPEYGAYAQGIGKYYYEINSQAYNASAGTTAATTCTADVICLRSVVARVYNK